MDKRLRIQVKQWITGFTFYPKLLEDAVYFKFDALFDLKVIEIIVWVIENDKKSY